MARALPTHPITQPYAAQATAQLRRDSLVALTGFALIGGLYLDGWAHIHTPDLETFFTPWHAVLYSGFLLLTLAIGLPVLVARLRNRSWQGAIPLGYGLGLLGIVLFGAGGVTDLAWHSLFGIEADSEALLSPPHLLLAIGAGLMLTTPLRAAWEKPGAAHGWVSWFPPLLSATLLLALLGFFTSYVHPFTFVAAASSERPVSHMEIHVNVDQAVASIMLQTAVLSGVLLLLLRRWGGRWPVGSLTVLTLLTLPPLTLMFDRMLATGPLPLIAAAAMTGLVGDGVHALLQPSHERLWAVRLFAATIPMTLYGLYMTMITLNGGIWWSTPLIFGAIVLAGITGWLTSYLVFPPSETALRTEREGAEGTQ